MLVAKHILLHKGHVTYGPLAAGGMNWLKNSPIYYYFIAVLWSVTREPLLLMYLWAVLMTIQVVFAYYIGKKFQDHLSDIILLVLLQSTQNLSTAVESCCSHTY